MTINVHLDDAAVSIMIESLETSHRKLVRDAESWSFDLENDYDKYVEARNKELSLAVIIHTIKTQHTFQKTNPDVPLNVPLADWELALLRGDKS